MDTPATSMVFALNQTSSPTATTTRDTTANSRPASVFKEPLSSEDNAKSSQPAPSTPTTMVSNASVHQDSSSVDQNAPTFKSNSQPAPIMPISMVFPAPAMLDSSRAASQPAHPARPVPNGTVSTASPLKEKTAAPTDTTTTMSPATASQKLLHAVITDHGTVLPASALTDTTESTINAKHALPIQFSMAVNAQLLNQQLQLLVDLMRSLLIMPVSAAMGSSRSTESVFRALRTLTGTVNSAFAAIVMHQSGAMESLILPIPMVPALARAAILTSMDFALLHEDFDYG